jgi:hypothetical protein
MALTQTADSEEMLEVANRASSILIQMMRERAITSNPNAFTEEVTVLCNELKQRIQGAFPFLDQHIQISLNIAEPTPDEEPGQWHPHITINHKGQRGEAFLDFVVASDIF